MNAASFIDTSVLIAAMIAGEKHHDACKRLLDLQRLGFYAHGLAETFSTLTGGRAGFRLSAGAAVELMEEDYLPELQIATLAPLKTVKALREAENRGIRGGAIFDYLHLVTARESGAERLFTLNDSNFRSFHRSGDPEIVHP